MADNKTTAPAEGPRLRDAEATRPSAGGAADGLAGEELESALLPVVPRRSFAPPAATPQELLRLQRTVGNRAAIQLLANRERIQRQDGATGTLLAPGTRTPQKVVRMTLLGGRGLMIFELADGTREDVKLYYNGKLQPGTYTFDLATADVEPDPGGTPNAKGKVLEFWEPLDAKFNVTGKVPLTIEQWQGGGHRIQAAPELADAMPGTKVNYYFATDPELGGRYDYKWWCENDPSEAQRLGQPLRVDGPTENHWEATWAFAGRHTVVCEVTDKNTNTKERLEFYQHVRTESQILDETFGETKAADYTRFRAGLELRNLDLMQGGIQDQSGTGKPPFITCGGANPVVPGRAPDYAYNTYTITPSPGAKSFRWSARPQVWDLLPTQEYFGFKKASIKGVDAYDLASTGPSARFIIADAQVWTIVCEEFDGSGQPIGTGTTYRQVIQTEAQAEQLGKWQAYMKQSDAAVGKIAEGKEVGLRAAYVNRETGQTMPLQLYVGPSVTDPKTLMLVDLLPGVDKIEYSGSSIDAALSDFETNNAYPKGTIRLEVPANASGIPAVSKAIATKGESDWQLWSSRVGWASLGLTVAGVVAAVIPGGQPVAAVFFIAAGATGAASAGMSLHDRLRQAQPSGAGIALDVAAIAGSMIGAAGAVRALRAGSQALALAGKTGQFLLYSGFVTNTVSGLIIGVEGVDQIVKILDAPMSRGEKISALVRVLGTLIVQGVLYVLSVREVRQLRVRVGGFVGKELANQLSAEVLHSLNLLDDTALKALGGLNAQQLERVAQLARVDPRLANRLASMPGLALHDHEVGVAGGVLSLDGQIKLSPGKLTAMSDDEVKNLLRATKALKAVGGDLSKLGDAERKLVDSLTRSAGQRLRFEAQLSEVDTFLNDLGAKADPRGQRLFTNMSDGERRRVYDLVNADRSGTGILDKQASNFALGRARSVNEYVELFESYVATYKKVLADRVAGYQAAVDKEVQARLAANPSMSAADKAKLPRIVQKALSKAEFGEEIEGFGKQLNKAMAAKVETELGVMNDPTKAGSGAALAQATLEANVKALAGHIGTERISSGLSEADVIAKVKAIPEVKFNSETAASYHVEKHGDELPPGELTGSKVTDFLNSANKTVHDGTAVVKVNQDGSRTVIFTREVTDGASKYTMTAMVNVADDGTVSLATYMGQKGK